jgi:hypothetical protein
MRCYNAAMDEQRKKAYRYLLYHAMLDIRPIGWMSFGFPRILNPNFWRNVVRRVRRAGVIADLLHNLAFFSATDFRRFDEEWFWKQFQSYEQRHRGLQLSAYKDVFERELSGSGHLRDD